MSDSNKGSSVPNHLLIRLRQVHPLDFEQDLHLDSQTRSRMCGLSFSRHAIPSSVTRSTSRSPGSRLHPREERIRHALSLAYPAAPVSPCTCNSLEGHVAETARKGRTRGRTEGVRGSHTEGLLPSRRRTKTRLQRQKQMHRGDCPEHQLRRTARAVQAARGCSHRGSCRLPSFLRKVTHIGQRSIGAPHSTRAEAGELV